MGKPEMGPCTPRPAAVAVEMCSHGHAVLHRLGFCFWVYCQYNKADNTMLEESTRCLKIFVPLPLLPLLALPMQQKMEKWAPHRNQIICFLSSSLSRWWELSAAHCILPAQQVQLDPAGSGLSLCFVQLHSADATGCLRAGGHQPCASFFSWLWGVNSWNSTLYTVLKRGKEAKVSLNYVLLEVLLYVKK